MARLGTWTTFDCPDDEVKTAEAYLWLKEKVQAIGGDVRKVINAHDFGEYPSFEIDKPFEFRFYDEEEEDEEMAEKVGKWEDGINKIELEFSNKYHND